MSAKGETCSNTSWAVAADKASVVELTREESDSSLTLSWCPAKAADHFHTTAFYVYSTLLPLVVEVEWICLLSQNRSERLHSTSTRVFLLLYILSIKSPLKVRVNLLFLKDFLCGAIWFLNNQVLGRYSLTASVTHCILKMGFIFFVCIMSSRLSMITL